MIKEKDLPEFGRAMAWLADKYPTQVMGITTPRATTDLWLLEYFKALQDLSLERVMEGAKWHYGHSEFFPDTPASLRKSIEAIPRKPSFDLPIMIGSIDDPETPPEEAKIRLEEIRRIFLQSPTFHS